MAAFSPAGQEAGGAALSISGRQELNGAVAGCEKRYFYSVVGRVEPLEEAEAKDAAVGGKGLVEVLDDDADVVDLGVG